MEWGGGFLAWQASSQRFPWGGACIQETSGWFYLRHNAISPKRSSSLTFVFPMRDSLANFDWRLAKIMGWTNLVWLFHVYSLIRSHHRDIGHIIVILALWLQASVRVTFRNPLKEELTQCYFLFEASGVVRYIFLYNNQLRQGALLRNDSSH